MEEDTAADDGHSPGGHAAGGHLNGDGVPARSCVAAATSEEAETYHATAFPKVLSLFFLIPTLHSNPFLPLL